MFPMTMTLTVQDESQMAALLRVLMPKRTVLPPAVEAAPPVVQPVEVLRVEPEQPPAAPPAPAPAPAPAPVAAKPEPAVEYAMVAAAITAAVPKDRAKVAAVLKQFGAARGPALLPEQYAEFLAALKAAFAEVAA